VESAPVVGGPDVDRLRLLASAIARRTVEVAVAGAGEPAWADGTTVFVDAHAAPAEQVRMVGVQAALLGAGSLDPAVVRQLTARSALARRYLAVEGHRALAATEPVLPWGLRSLVDPALAASVDGPEASLAAARTRRGVDDPPGCFGVIRPRRILAASERADRDAPAGETARTHHPHDELPPELDDDADDEEDGQDVGHLLSSPVGGRGALGRLLQRLLRATREPGGGGPAGADRPTRAGRARPRGRGHVALAGRAPAVPDGATAFVPRARTYPEWDAHRRRYRPDWCTVHERDPRPDDLAPVAMPDGVALRRPLAPLGTALARTHRRLQGDDIDVDAAVEAWVEELAGSPPDEAVYVESLRRRRDLAVLILLDVSGSAGEPGPGGRTVHEHQRSAAAALTTALHDLGDRVALYAFNSQGRKAVHVTRVKGFDDRLDSRVVRRLGGLAPGAYTRLGAAIRHGAAVLEEGGGTSRRLLLVLSDGFAYDHGYAGRYGEADARRALTEARRRGLGCLCLSVGGDTPPVALRRVFGTAAHAAVPTPDQLPGLIGPLFRAALRSAEAQRRTFQRKERTRGQLALERRTS
jgi:nitric oxide reductase NorD protein